MKGVLLLAALLPLALAANVRNGALGSSSNYVNVDAFNDVSAPEITDMTCTNTLVDVTGPTITSCSCTITAVDLFAPASGVLSAAVQFQSPSGKQHLRLGCGGFANGQVTCSATLPRFSETGIWYLEYANVTDNARNRRTYRHGDTNFLSQSYTVVGKSDTWAPRINYFAIQNNSVTAVSNGLTNPSWSHTPFTILLNCTDIPPTGEWTDCADTMIYFTPPAGTQLPGGRYEIGVHATLFSTLEPGIRRQRSFLTTDTGFLGRGYPSGEWKVSRIRTRDGVGNEFEYGASEIQNNPIFAGQQGVTVAQASYPDRTPPVVTSYAVFPGYLNLVDRSALDRVCVNVTLQGDLTVTGGGPFRVQARTWVLIDGPTPSTIGPCDGLNGASVAPSAPTGCYYEIQQPGPFTLMRYCVTPPGNFDRRPGGYFVAGVVADDGLTLEPDNQAAGDVSLRYANQALYGYCSRYDANFNTDNQRPGICYDDNKPSSASSLIASMGLAAVLALLALFH